VTLGYAHLEFFAGGFTLVFHHALKIMNLAPIFMAQRYDLWHMRNASTWRSLEVGQFKTFTN